MMLAGPTLRVVPVTTHIPLRDVPERAHHRADRRQGPRRDHAACSASSASSSPRLAVAGLNPHAGEDGALGREEIEIIVPAIERLREEGYRGRAARTRPTPCSTSAARRDYDAALCMYHDQALIPLKTLHFDEGDQRDARPADRAHLARSRHRLRHRRQGHGRSRRDDRRDPHRRRLRAPARRRRDDAATACRRCAR